MGDAAAARFPDHGRIAVTQFSVVSGVPLSLLLMKVSPAFATALSTNWDNGYSRYNHLSGFFLWTASLTCN